jgi:nicotinate-nucleotide adenylyltransferase
MENRRVRTALFGGTFDPVHVGHLFVAEEVLDQLEYERILFVPARVPPHKRAAPQASGEQRVQMLSIAIGDNQRFALDPFEVNREDVSFTINTLRHLIDSGTVEGRPGLIIGEDLVAGFDSWREADEIERLADIILVRRPPEKGMPATGHEGSFARRHTSIDNLTLRVSSSEIRERVSSGRPYRYLVPSGVHEYIEANGLYR